MNDKVAGPTFTDRKGMGGVIAQDGFDYQLWDGLARLPAWLANPAFEGMIFEGLEDIEARFFAPQAPAKRLLERYQCKSAQLTPAKVKEVFQSFRVFDKAHPAVTRLQTLVTPLLPDTLKWVERDPGRVRRARPFYAPFPRVLDASVTKLKDDFIKEFGSDIGVFIAESVEVSLRNIPDSNSALSLFNIALHESFPHLDVGLQRVRTAFDAIRSLAHKHQGAWLSREVLIQTLEQGLGQHLLTSTSYPLHIRSDRNGSDERALEIDASAFSLGQQTCPSPEIWQERLLLPLDDTAQWLRTRNTSRIVLGGSYRLTTAFALGWIFRSAHGFDLEIPTRAEPWATDIRGNQGGSYPQWNFQEALHLDGNKLNVSIGILREPRLDLISSAAVPTDSIFSAFLDSPLTNAEEAQAGVARIKDELSRTIAKLRPTSIDLYFAGPAAFAVALGHRWNALPPTQLHEFQSHSRGYVPSALLK